MMFGFSANAGVAIKSVSKTTVIKILFITRSFGWSENLKTGSLAKTDWVPFLQPTSPYLTGATTTVQRLSCTIDYMKILLKFLIGWMVSISSVSADDDFFSSGLKPALEQSCIKCHGSNNKSEAEVNLAELKTSTDLTSRPELIEVLIEVLDTKTMPPESEPELGPDQRGKMIGALRHLLDKSLANQSRYPQTPIRRMNRFQYNNAVQDLFQLTPVVFSLPERMLRDYGYFDPSSGQMPTKLNAGSRPLGKSQLIESRLGGVGPFPQDLRAEHGFDNRGDHLTLSPLLLESFLQLSRSIVESPDFHERSCGIWTSFFAEPQGDEDVKSIVKKRLRVFLTNAFRRPVAKEVLDRYSAHVISRIDNGESFTAAMKIAASAALASPRFLYLYDQANTNTGVQSLDDFELATRLSFFLWGSIPDQTLLELASRGELQKPEELERQVDRMLNDKKLKRFCDSFPSQWMQLERIISSTPDQALYPQFYFAKFRVSIHMMLEPLLIFETILVENRSILELVDSDFSYRSALLESWYKNGTRSKSTPPAKIPFKRVNLNDRRQGGVITNAAVMTMTSNPTRTQPITRGAWISSVIFNSPPEPPPADVPPLPEDDAMESGDLTLRERFAAHRNRPECSGCHLKIDPLGFALENYGATGIWRDKYKNGRAIDPSGVLFRTHKFRDIVEFKDAILAEKKRFAKAFTKHLMSFALGRETVAIDSPALNSIVEKTAQSEFKIRDLIKQVVLSEPFLQKYNPPREKVRNSDNLQTTFDR